MRSQSSYVVQEVEVATQEMGTESPVERRSGFGSVGTWRKVAAAVVIVVGVVFIVITIANNLFEVGPAFEEMVDDFRPILQEEALEQAQQDVDGLAAAGEEFQTSVAPAMAQQLGLSPEEFGALVESEYPAVALGMQALPEITQTFTGLIETLDSQRELFASADAIPTDDLPANTVPWIILLSGLAAIIVGILMFIPGRTWPIVAVVLGAGLVIITFALNLPQKAADADELNENLTPIYTQELIDGATASLGVVSAMGAQMQTEMLPDLAAQLGMSPDELNQFLGENFPATAAAMQTMPEALERFEGFVGVFAANLDNYETIQPVSFSPIIWAMVLGGIVIILMGGWAIIVKD
jgi:hypothetical protein